MVQLLILQASTHRWPKWIGINAAARANTGAMTITGSGAADTIAMENTGDILTGGGGSDTLAI